MTDEDDENRNEPGIFLSVEKVSDGYIETDRTGNKHRYVRLRGLSTLTIEALNTHQAIDPLSGNKVTTIRGRTRQKIRAIGVTGEYPIFFVELAVHDQPGKATIVESYRLSGDSLNSTLSISLSHSAMSTLSEALKQARSSRVVCAQFKEGSFLGEHADLSSADSFGELLLLPWLEEQKKATNEEVTVEFNLEVVNLTVSPEHGGFFRGEAEDAQKVDAGISNHVGIYYSSDSTHPLQTIIRDVHSEMSAMRSSIATLVQILIGVAILLVVYIVHLWR